MNTLTPDRYVTGVIGKGRHMGEVVSIELVSEDTRVSKIAAP